MPISSLFPCAFYLFILWILNSELNDFNGHLNIHLHTNVLHAIRLAFHRLLFGSRSSQASCCLCSCASSSLFLSFFLFFPSSWLLFCVDLFRYFFLSTTTTMATQPLTNNETYFYGENRLIRNEMISIKMFSLLVAIQLSLFLRFQ